MNGDTGSQRRRGRANLRSGVDKTVILEIEGTSIFQAHPRSGKPSSEELRVNRMSRVVLKLEKMKHIDSSGIASLFRRRSDPKE